MNEAELLFTEILNCNRLDLYLNKKLYLDKDNSTFISSALKRRIYGEPIQYILGKTEFMGLSFKVNKDVFIPRPDTEILVETVVKLASSVNWSVPELNILDLGTGSGCIAISLAKSLKNAKLTATDISKEALEIAKENALLNNVEINFLQSDLFNSYPLPLTPYHLIISNPPYIPTQELDNLQLEIKYEPRMALDGGEDGLDFYRWISKLVPAYFKVNGFLIMEMGFKQKDALKDILEKSGDFKIIEIVKDYNNIDRVIVAQYINQKWISSL